MGWQARLTICDREPSVLLLDLEIITNVVGAVHFRISLLVLLSRLIVVGRLGSSSGLDIFGLFGGLRHL